MSRASQPLSSVTASASRITRPGTAALNAAAAAVPLPGRDTAPAAESTLQWGAGVDAKGGRVSATSRRDRSQRAPSAANSDISDTSEASAPSLRAERRRLKETAVKGPPLRCQHASGPPAGFPGASSALHDVSGISEWSATSLSSLGPTRVLSAAHTRGTALETKPAPLRGGPAAGRNRGPAAPAEARRAPASRSDRERDANCSAGPVRQGKVSRAAPPEASRPRSAVPAPSAPSRRGTGLRGAAPSPRTIAVTAKGPLKKARAQSSSAEHVPARKATTLERERSRGPARPASTAAGRGKAALSAGGTPVGNRGPLTSLDPNSSGASRVSRGTAASRYGAYEHDDSSSGASDFPVSASNPVSYLPAHQIAPASRDPLYKTQSSVRPFDDRAIRLCAETDAGSAASISRRSISSERLRRSARSASPEERAGEMHSVSSITESGAGIPQRGNADRKAADHSNSMGRPAAPCPVAPSAPHDPAGGQSGESSFTVVSVTSLSASEASPPRPRPSAHPVHPSAAPIDRSGRDVRPAPAALAPSGSGAGEAISTHTDGTGRAAGAPSHTGQDARDDRGATVAGGEGLETPGAKKAREGGDETAATDGLQEALSEVQTDAPTDARWGLAPGSRHERTGSPVARRGMRDGAEGAGDDGDAPPTRRSVGAVEVRASLQGRLESVAGEGYVRRSAGRWAEPGVCLVKSGGIGRDAIDKGDGHPPPLPRRAHG